MKILAVLGAFVIECAAAKSWNSDSYAEEAYSVFGWFGYLKRITLIVLMLTGVILYYVPESRPHARRICYALIDITANGLKSALCARESDYEYEEIKSKYHRSRNESLVSSRRKHTSQEDENDEDLVRLRKGCKKSKVFIHGDGITGCRERKRLNGKQSKEYRQTRPRVRNSIVKDISGEPCMEVAKPVYFYSDKLEDLQKYLQENLSGAKRASVPSIESYAFLISGTPQQMAVLEQKYEKDDVVIVQDPYIGMEYKECGTSMDKLSSMAEASVSEIEGPTRDDNNNNNNNNHRVTDSGMETCLREVDLCSIPENSTFRYSLDKSRYRASQFARGTERDRTDAWSASSADLNTRESVAKNVLKLSRSTMSSKMYRNRDGSTENVCPVNYDHCHDDRPIKAIGSSSTRKTAFRNEDGKEVRARQKHEEGTHHRDNECRARRRSSDSPQSFCCKELSCFTDRDGEADDENSLLEGLTSKNYLDQRPERENACYYKNSVDSILDCVYDDRYAEPILKKRSKPIQFFMPSLHLG